MKLLGRWSVASFMKLAVDVSYYFVLVIGPVAFGFALWWARRGWTLNFGVPVQFQVLHPASHFVMRPGVQQAFITQAHGTLEVVGRVSVLGVVFAGLRYGIVWLVVLLVLNRLRAILRTLRDQNPFDVRNASRIRMMGAALVMGVLANAVLGGWFAHHVIREFSVSGLWLEADRSVNDWVIFAGVILVMLAEVFRLGADMKGDLETARKIQLDLLPGETFRKSDAVVCARMRPAKTVGGDLYDVFELDNRRLAVVVGDVTAKGLPAAMLMASVVGSMHALCSAGLGERELIAAINKYVCSTNTSGDRLLTLFYGELDTTTGELTYVNAGHNPPILLHFDGRMDRLQPTAMVLGVMADTAVESGQVEIKLGDRLLLFTDGFPEAFNKKDEEYGEQRLTESFSRVRTLSPSIVVERLIADVVRFCGSVPPHDDMTLMLVERQSSHAPISDADRLRST